MSDDRSLEGWARIIEASAKQIRGVEPETPRGPLETIVASLTKAGHVIETIQEDEGGNGYTVLAVSSSKGANDDERWIQVTVDSEYMAM